MKQQTKIRNDRLTSLIVVFDINRLPLHQNAFYRRATKKERLKFFKAFVLANIIPTSRTQREKTHYLIFAGHGIRPRTQSNSAMYPPLIIKKMRLNPSHISLIWISRLCHLCWNLCAQILLVVGTESFFLSWV